MKSQDAVGVTFVNLLLVRGVSNGVVNLTFGTYNHSPSDLDDPKAPILPDAVVASRLRMDVPCAKQLHEQLGELLKHIEAAQTATPPTLNGEGLHPDSKPN